MELQNDLLIRAAKGEKTERTPVWLMRQAGRILPEYRAVRNKLSGFIELAQTPELAAEVTIQPVDILGVDAAIIFSDILVIPEAMGLPYEMIEKKGPNFPSVISSEEDVRKLKVADAESDLGYVLEAIKITKKELNGRVPLIGFAGAPWTIFCYMVEGHGSKTFSKARRMLYNNPVLADELMQMITDSTIAYLKAQIAAGANIVQVFDSWAGILSPEHYTKYSMKYISQICDAIDEVPVTVFAKGAFFARSEMRHLNCETIGLDWNMDIAESRRLIGEGKTLQGNLDPCTLYASNKEVENATKKMLDQFGTHRHIANLGHGVYPDTDPEKVKVFINTVKEYSAQMRSAAV
ncbi:uroporphyrinogen decarboxylase [Roseivirga pacifica]|uniref:Uroporphyrinogen decarboxylase n=1 Tax=Roseivirga pacifica TaxID=1267423 RepID=A0A1I0NE79_9BACT|nr:uroporphyrinogen decarboxylase [Roseivirga pacifica]MCO6359654.1 uroporphyrinogen decarboxylase [Roseivirga pacifica]MCO6367024.1 uroporphyrinogen decarboxylase [Roseivirga pacifica]MCO6370444.1 uroporphyrinogen decarboxylase [Roseivirga pacifica]MCO6374681.1 uroporphyrinogen decarboxylase [Roseivirga pacifica]MCO6379939.1 uroporphyrinogen decarboxylase [Roseivirga pacifica]